MHCRNVLDPFGGTGKLALIKDFGFKGLVVCNEIEAEWAQSSPHPVDEWHIGDAQDMSWAKDSSFDAICTSPTYGNRMADHFNSKDGSRRITYRHYLGRPLKDNNSGKMQWGAKYKLLHTKVYEECFRVLVDRGIFILNISNHIRKGVEIDVSAWHCEELQKIGFTRLDTTTQKTPKMGFGDNARARTFGEYIITFEKAIGR